MSTVTDAVMADNSVITARNAKPQRRRHNKCYCFGTTIGVKLVTMESVLWFISGQIKLSNCIIDKHYVLSSHLLEPPFPRTKYCLKIIINSHFWNFDEKVKSCTICKNVFFYWACNLVHWPFAIAYNWLKFNKFILSIIIYSICH